ncbi:MAG: hypothetical protein MUE69_09740 [Myxococcota bacterium]|nr:hypothetical protein [Myxococcota bacterium]
MRRLARFVGPGRLAGFGPSRTSIGVVLAEIVLASVTSGCSGGQTGEITEPTRCERVTEEVERAHLPSEIQVALEAAERTTGASLEWIDADGAASRLSLSLSHDGTAFERLGDDACPPSWRASYMLHATTEDTRFAATLNGTLTVREVASDTSETHETSATVVAEAPLAMVHLDGFEADDEPGGAETMVRLFGVHVGPAWRGTLVLQDDEGERVLAAF